MNIGIVTTWFERGAAYVSRMYKETLENDHKVHIYARGGEGYAKNNPDWDTENVHWGKRVPMRGISTYIDDEDFESWIKLNDIEVVFFNEQRWWQTLLLCKKLGVRTGAYIDYYTDKTVKLHDVYDFVICNTKRHYSAFSEHKKCFFVPWGTDVELFNVSGSENSEKDNNDLVFFHSAGMNPYRKGTDYVIEAFSMLVKEFSNVKLVIHTQACLKKYFPSLIGKIDILTSENYLEVINKTITAPGLYHAADVYVYPSRLEGIGLTLAEALSCGMPVITTDQPPMNEFAPPSCSKVVAVKKMSFRDDGYYWPMCEVDVYELASKMSEYVRDIDMLCEYKIKAREYAENELDWRKNTTAISEIFKESTYGQIDKKLKTALILEDNKLYPLIARFPQFYENVFRLFYFLRRKIL